MLFQERLVFLISRGNWLVFALFCLFALWFVRDMAFFRGVFFGGIIVNTNFYMLGKTLEKSFSSSKKVSIAAVISRYYLRFIISGVLIFILLLGRFVAPLGLILGLSVVVVTLLCTTILTIIKFISNKEAS